MSATCWAFESLGESLEKLKVLVNSSKHMDKSSEYAFLHPWLGTGLLTSTSDKWRSRRKMLNSQTLVLLKKLQKKKDQGHFNIFPDIAMCALDIICACYQIFQCAISFRSQTAMGQHVSAQTKESDYVRAVIRICSLLEKRMRTPWHWNKVLYNIFGQGQEHDECREILHDFTQKVIKDRHSTFDTKKAEEVLGCLKFDDTTESRTKRLAFLDMLLYMSMSDQTLSTDDIKEEVETFMFEVMIQCVLFF
ncbi:hypothetical protein C0Q70_15548 [Pomacea canaliculata]|uniref:Cytochrome P450 n=1 Tax=Pomacea canaliculata TaxID=400727 RepID=A0A2T7NV50_POMCA|nr:hypothetical protein C0Q70_15548 [Pomacea canaliculata]